MHNLQVHAGSIGPDPAFRPARQDHVNLRFHPIFLNPNVSKDSSRGWHNAITILFRQVGCVLTSRHALYRRVRAWTTTCGASSGTPRTEPYATVVAFSANSSKCLQEYAHSENYPLRQAGLKAGIAAWHAESCEPFTAWQLPKAHTWNNLQALAVPPL